MQLSKIGEFGLIKRIDRLCKGRSKRLVLGIGDDAAAIKSLQGFTLITSDMLIEGIHFDLTYITFYQLGYKALAVNMSDIFAMGGKPKFFLMNIGIPERFDSRDVEEIYGGMIELAERFGVAVIGGDTSVSRRGLLLSGTLIGEAKDIIRRSGARPGDGIFVIGTLGDSAMGLELLRKTGKRIQVKRDHYSHSLIKRHLLPEPRPLRRTDKVTSMIDISDGLLIDLGHICDASNVGAVIYKERIPLSEELINVASAMKKDPFDYALRGGEDYALLFTSPSKDKKGATRIGEIIKKGRYIIDEKRRKTPFKLEGYEHFKSKV
jgi:thiamine-monophosphate kinase